MNKNLKELLNEFLNMIKAGLHSFTEEIKIDSSKRKLANQLQQQQVFERNIFNFMTEIQTELFQVLHQNHYSCFAVEYPNNIRICNWRQNQNQLIYTFSINRNNRDTVMSDSGLRNVQKRINDDIQIYKNNLLHQYPNPSVIFPILVSGMFVVNIRLVSEMLLLDVVTQLRPF